MTPREKIAAKIRALKAKTVENGCTEAEALSAAGKVAQMLAEYGMTLDEAELRETPFAKHEEAHTDDVGQRIWKPAMAIEVLTGARHWTSSYGVWPVEQHFFGFAHEVEVAAYLLEICTRAMRSERDRMLVGLRGLRPAQIRNELHPFLDGMADRLRERILDLVPPKPTGTGLVVLREELITDALAEIGIEIAPMKTRHGQRGGEAYDAGRAAAELVAFNAGLRGDREFAALAAR